MLAGKLRGKGGKNSSLFFLSVPPIVLYGVV